MNQSPFRHERTTIWKKITFHLRNVMLVFLVISPVLAYIGVNLAFMNGLPQRADPYVHFNGLDPSREAFITWETVDSRDSALWLGTDIDSMNLHAINSSTSTLHRIKLSGLEPGETYYYQAGSISGGDRFHGRVGRFTTAPVVNKSFSIGVFADSQQFLGIGHYQAIAKLMGRDKDLSFISCIGDLVQEGYRQDNWNLFWHQSKPWMPHASIVPATGNHDYNEGDAGRSHYTKYFGYSYTNGSHANHFYYSFNWSNVQFVIGEISTVGTVGGNPSFNVTLHDTWINQTLDAGQSMAFRILMFHRNPMSSTFSDPYLMDRIGNIAEDYNVSLIMFGHAHHYERMVYQGQRYLCLGCGGGMQDGAFNVIPESEILSIGPCYTRITFNIDEMHVRTISEHGDVIDAFTLVQDGSRAVLDVRGA